MVWRHDKNHKGGRLKRKTPAYVVLSPLSISQATPLALTPPILLSLQWSDLNSPFRPQSLSLYGASLRYLDRVSMPCFPKGPLSSILLTLIIPILCNCLFNYLQQ